jgi:hypothetical protein
MSSTRMLFRSTPSRFDRSIAEVDSWDRRLGQTAHPSYLIGYRFTHISNAYTAESNPGFNAHLFFLGIAIR